MKFVDLLLYSEEAILTKEELLKAHRSNLCYFPFLDHDITCYVIQHAAFNEDFEADGVSFRIFKSRNRTWKLYLKTFFMIRKLQADVILVHSFIYAWQILWLKLIVGRNTKIIVQNHAEKPFKGLKNYLQKLANHFVSAYLFVSKLQARPWFEENILTQEYKIHEVMEGSTTFVRHEQSIAKKNFDSSESLLFLWVGRLDANKDPLTILKAFKRYRDDGFPATLQMIYNSYELLPEVEKFIATHELSHCIRLIGKTEHAALEAYYNAADYFILGSHYEGSGYALCEAMACGCVPVVTRIPSFISMLNNGSCGYLFEAGNAESLYTTLRTIHKKDLLHYRTHVLQKFHDDLSHQAIGKKISGIVKQLSQK